jgi:hypothetical protein
MIPFADVFPEPEIVEAPARQLSWSLFVETTSLNNDLHRGSYSMLYPIIGADDHPGPVAGRAEIGIVRDAAQFVW